MTPPATDDREVLYPNQSTTRQINVPAGTFFKASPFGEYVRMKFVATYRGEASDPNAYFYAVVLKIAMREKQTYMRADIFMELTDEGTVRAADVNRLLDS